MPSEPNAKPRKYLYYHDGPLHSAAHQRWGNACPCCMRPMQRGRVKRGQAPPSNHRTVGHDQSVARGGDARVWVWQCLQCNNDQGVLDFVTWWRKLERSGDWRAINVQELVAFVAAWHQQRRQAT